MLNKAKLRTAAIAIILASDLSLPAFANDKFDLWTQCTDSCLLDLSNQKIWSSPMDLSSFGQTSEQGVLHFSMVLGGNNDSVKIGIDNAFSLLINENSIQFKGVSHTNKPVKFNYTRQNKGNISVNWLVPIGGDTPSEIKVFIHEVNSANQITSMSPIYTIPVSNEVLSRLEKNSTLDILGTNSNSLSYELIVKNAGVSIASTQSGPTRNRRWTNWDSGKTLCFIDPLNAIYNYLSRNTCQLDDTWEGKVYLTLYGSPAAHDIEMPASPISTRTHFSEGGSLAALTAQRVCAIPLETFMRHRQPRGWEDLERCGYPVNNLIDFYIAARHSWSQVDQVIQNALDNPESDSDLDRAIRKNPQQSRLALTTAAQTSAEFVSQSSNNTEASAANADILTLTCPLSGLNCVAPADGNEAHQERIYPTGAVFLGDGDDISFTTRGTQHWTTDRLIAAHQQLTSQGYVFVGYHGTFLEAAHSIVFEGVRARSQSLDNAWHGFYIAGDPAVSYGYALDQDPDPNTGRIRNGVMLRVYVRQESLPNFYQTNVALSSPEAVNAVSSLIGHTLPLQLDSITGQEDEEGRLETIIGWPLAEQLVVIPSTISTDPRNPGGDLDSSSIPEAEKTISVLPNYSTSPTNTN
ncbi:exotoxin A binding domain-containing protein [Serratia sp. UGAL515B_01]|uniref:exotoxin A binding domain-containing protein n=1 Tax=Serratia sp. UGAL515B_01 TaxID=2986763 RepID=UPI002952EA29|nr:exotoxin A binding domain-containing protein [Serratia sp. UGAL515B_01]WON77712.1 hypothetical protein OK023_03160 [Serratia sp. UGAL515B_01]